MVGRYRARAAEVGRAPAILDVPAHFGREPGGLGALGGASDDVGDRRRLVGRFAKCDGPGARERGARGSRGAVGRS